MVWENAEEKDHFGNWAPRLGEQKEVFSQSRWVVLDRQALRQGLLQEMSHGGTD